MKKLMIDPKRLKRFKAKAVHLRKGTGKGANGTIDVCVMQAVDWLAGGAGIADHPECAARSLAAYCIRLNDSPLFEKHRDLLKPYAPKLVGTVAGVAVERKRAFIAADYAVRVFAPIWLRALGYAEHADKLAACATIIDKDSALAAQAVARDAADAAYAAATAAADAATTAYAAYAAADAATAAADAATAAYAATAAADAAYAATAAADAAADAYAAAYAALKKHGAELRKKALECLDKMIAVK